MGLHRAGPADGHPAQYAGYQSHGYFAAAGVEHPMGAPDHLFRQLLSVRTLPLLPSTVRTLRALQPGADPLCELRFLPAVAVQK